MTATRSTKCLKEADLVCGRRSATGTTNGEWTAEKAQAGIPEANLGRCRSGFAGERPILASPALILPDPCIRVRFDPDQQIRPESTLGSDPLTRVDSAPTRIN